MTQDQPRRCPSCESQAEPELLTPQGFWEKQILARFGMLPFRCPDCQSRFYRRSLTSEEKIDVSAQLEERRQALADLFAEEGTSADAPKKKEIPREDQPVSEIVSSAPDSDDPLKLVKAVLGEQIVPPDLRGMADVEKAAEESEKEPTEPEMPPLAEMKDAKTGKPIEEILDPEDYAGFEDLISEIKKAEQRAGLDVPEPEEGDESE